MSQINPLIFKSLSGTNAVFNGTCGDVLGAGKIDTGEITIVAKIKINSMDDVAEGFHYIVAQNNGDNTKPEIFLRLRGQKGRVIFECGVGKIQITMKLAWTCRLATSVRNFLSLAFMIKH